MSILQEFEEIKREMGREQWDLLETYLTEVRPDLRLDEVLYEKEKHDDFAAWAKGERNECDILGELFNEWNNLDHHEFIINMADHLDSEDYTILHEIYEKKRIIENILKTRYGLEHYEEEMKRRGE